MGWPVELRRALQSWLPAADSAVVVDGAYQHSEDHLCRTGSIALAARLV